MSEFEELATRVMALPSESRAELAELLIQSLEEPDDPEIKSAWRSEIAQRDQEIRDGASVTIPADQVLGGGDDVGHGHPGSMSRSVTVITLHPGGRTTNTQ